MQCFKKMSNFINNLLNPNNKTVSRHIQLGLKKFRITKKIGTVKFENNCLSNPKKSSKISYLVKIIHSTFLRKYF